MLCESRAFLYGNKKLLHKHNIMRAEVLFMNVKYINLKTQECENSILKTETGCQNTFR